MNFMYGPSGWYISFREADCYTSLPRKLNFASEEKILDLAERGGAPLTSETRAMLAHGISIGRGGVWLNLTSAQYQLLRTSPVRQPRL